MVNTLQVDGLASALFNSALPTVISFIHSPSAQKGSVECRMRKTERRTRINGSDAVAERNKRNSPKPDLVCISY